MTTKQETYDAVKAGLMAQGAFAYDIYECCQYRTSDGNKCAVGLLLADAEYTYGLDEGYGGVGEIYDECPSLQYHDLELLTDLQCAHDSVANANDFIGWAALMIKVADKHGLRA